MEIEQKYLDEAWAFLGFDPPPGRAASHPVARLPPRARAAARTNVDLLMPPLIDPLGPMPVATSEPAQAQPANTAQPGGGVPLEEAGPYLRAAREEYGMSLGELEEQTGMSRGRLSRIETRLTPNPTIDTLIRIAAAMGLRLLVTLGDLESEA